MFKNFFWDFVGRFSGQVLAFTFSVFLTRILDPSQFGLIGVSMVVIAVANVFLDMGFKYALVQKAEVSREEYSAVFYLSLGISFLLAIICFFIAQPLAVFYRQPSVEPIIRVLSSIFIINALTLIPNTIIYKKMDFKAISTFNIIAAVISGTTGITLAIKGFGVWSLVAQTLSSSVCLWILYQGYTRWTPILGFNFSWVKPLWGYGSKMFLATLSDNLFSRLDVFIIGRIFPLQTVGFYTRAQSLDQFVRHFSANNIVTVLFPQIAKLQHDRDTLRQLYVRFLHLISFLSVGLSGFLFTIAEPLFTMLFTEKWLFAAELFKIMALMGFAWPVSALMCNIIAGVGNSKVLLGLEIPKRLIMILVFIFGFLWGIKGFLYTLTLSSMITISLNAYYAGRELQFRLWPQWKVIIPYLLATTVTVLITMLILFWMDLSTVYHQIAIGTSSYILIYLLINYLIGSRGLFDLLQVVSLKRLSLLNN